MLKRKYRLNQRIKAKAQRSFKTPFFVLRIAENDLGYNRFGFVVSKKVDKRAVIRNKVKRMLRGEIELKFEEIKKGFDILFMLNKEIVNATKDEIGEVLYNLLKKENLLR